MQTAGHPSYFRSARRTIAARGAAATLTPGTIDTLDARVRAFFRAAPDGPPLLLGALPFDRRQADLLVRPLPAPSGGLHPVPSPRRPGPRCRVTAEPSAAAYGDMVARALAAMAAGGIGKVVLARRLAIGTDAPLDPLELVGRLERDPSATTFALPLPPGAGGGVRTLVGATPELLLSKDGPCVLSRPLAGSARRRPDAAADRAAAEALLGSEKNRREHAVVVEAILDTLAPHCETLATPAGPALHATASMWHLGTGIEGRLRDPGISAAGLVAQLHPTPAVCGWPREAALPLIRALEPFDRGFYAGAVGWIDARGDGEWHIALRCGEIEGRRIVLHAGAGIVAGSDPAAETDETSAKFLALLDALGIDEHGRVAAEVA